MIFLSSFTLSKATVTNPNIYPYNVVANKDTVPFIFDKITVFYGNNASGKSTLLNIIARKLNIKGAEELSTEHIVNGGRYFDKFVSECSYQLGETEQGKALLRLPKSALYLKSEDILYEIKKIQQRAALEQSLLMEYAQKGFTKKEYEKERTSLDYLKKMGNIVFAQEKYSNGETSLQIFDEFIETDSLYLLDEPEVSLSPKAQVALAEKLNDHTRLLGCQFIIATHSPFLLGTLNAKIYNLDTPDYMVCNWAELENVQYFYRFFQDNAKFFQ